MIATLVYTGLRIQECLGLVWGDTDFEAGLIRVQYQLTRATRKESPRRVPLKTRSSRREIRLEPDLASLLKRHKETAFGMRRAKPQDYVFTTSEGTPLYHRNVSLRGLKKAADNAGLKPRRGPVTLLP